MQLIINLPKLKLYIMFTPMGMLIQISIAILVVIGMVIMINRSSLTSDRKTALYVVTVLMPLVGLILFFIFKRKSRIPIN